MFNNIFKIWLACIIIYARAKKVESKDYYEAWNYINEHEDLVIYDYGTP